MKFDWIAECTLVLREYLEGRAKGFRPCIYYYVHSILYTYMYVIVYRIYWNSYRFGIAKRFSRYARRPRRSHHTRVRTAYGCVYNRSGFTSSSVGRSPSAPGFVHNNVTTRMDGYYVSIRVCIFNVPPVRSKCHLKRGRKRRVFAERKTQWWYSVYVLRDDVLRRTKRTRSPRPAEWSFVIVLAVLSENDSGIRSNTICNTTYTRRSRSVESRRTSFVYTSPEVFPPGIAREFVRYGIFSFW